MRYNFDSRGESFSLEEIYDADERVKGGNSCIFRASHPESGDHYIVKICRFASDTKRRKEIKRIERFEKEIEALHKAAASSTKDFVVSIVDDGSIEVGCRATLRYYVMEEADANLRKFLLENSLSTPQRVLLCKQLLSSLSALHAIDIYHRDIKPENILIFGQRWKFGDLGLISYRNEHPDLDDFDEKVGPIGFLSPEATNKAFGNRRCADFVFDCSIDEASDLFQLGQLFWFILQNEVPTGQLSLSDFRCGHAGVFENIIQKMLQYPKNRRPSIAQLEAHFQPVLQEFGL